MCQAFRIPLFKPVAKPVAKTAGFLLGAALALPASANPEGASVIHGTARFSHPTAGTLEVTNSDRAIINWRSFSIDRGETTRFVQPSAQSAVLNRVTGADPSSIHGRLDSNGKVFLINRHGILVGESGVINTAGFVGSTLDIADQDFLDNRLNFAGEAGTSILNEGFITSGAGGEIVLVSPEIENRGTLSAEDGDIVLAAGERVTLSSADFENIHFKVQAPGHKVLNLGEMIARGGSVGVFAGSIRHEGVIEADGIGTDAAGNIVLRAQSDLEMGSDALVQASGAAGGAITLQSESGDTVVRGTVEALGTDGTGGDIQILGERVGLFGDATIDASGRFGGGRVLAGGDFQGKGEVQTASQTQLNPDAAIRVDALESGDGGRAIVWADGFTSAYGTVSARGGDLSGDGGFVEISGKQDLLFRGRVDTRAPNGLTGTALFDPRDITIDGSTQASPFVDDSFDDSVGVDVTFGTQGGDGLDALLSTTNVLLQANRDIFIQAGIAGAGNDLTLMAGRSIIAPSGPFTVDTAGGDFTAIANATSDDGVVTSDRDAGAADIRLDSGNGFFIDSGGGNILLEIRDGAGRTGTQATMGSIVIDVNDGLTSGGGNIVLRADNGVSTIVGASINAGTGGVFLETYSPGATIDLGVPGTGDQLIDDVTLGVITADSVTIGNAGTGDISIEDALDLSGFINVAVKTGSDVVFNQPSQGLNIGSASMAIDAGGAIIGNVTGAPDIQGGTGSSLDLNTTAGTDMHVGVDQLSFNNSGEGLVHIISSAPSVTTTILGGNNSASGFSTVIEEQVGSLTIDGDISSAGLDILAFDGIANNAVVSGNGGGTALEVTGSSGTTISNNSGGVISDQGGVLIRGGSGNFVNTGVIDNAGGGADIVIESDFIDLAGGLIDAGSDHRTVLRSVTLGTWTLGDTGADVTGLDIIRNNIGVGDDTGPLNSVEVIDAITFTNGQNLGIHASGSIDFNQAAGVTAISGANGVYLDTGSINNFTAGDTDVDAAFLTIDAPGGVAEASSPLDTRVGRLDIAGGTGGIHVSNTGAVRVDRANTGGAISIANTGGNLTVRPEGVQIWDTPSTSTIDLVNTGGSIIVNGLVWSNGGDITLQATGATSDILINTGVLAERANVTLDAGRNVTVSGSPIALSDGATAVGALDGLLTVNAGNALTVQGGSGAEQRARLGALNMNITTGGNLSMLGGSANDTAAGINVIDSLYAEIGGDLRLTGGSGERASAIIGDENGSAVTLKYNIGGNLRLTGGTGASAAAGIGSGSGLATIEIGVNSDNTPVPIGGNIVLTAGSGGAVDGEPGAIAAIGSVGTDGADVTLRAAGSLTMRSNADSGDFAMIGSPDAGGSVDIAVGFGGSGNLNINTGLISSDLVRLEAASEAGTGGNIVLNGGIVETGDLTASAAGQFDLRGGLLDIDGPGSLGARFNISGGIARFGGTVALDGNYTQSGGVTVLDGGRLGVATRYDLLGGRLTGEGVVTTPLLNNTGGTIAPGLPMFPAGTDDALSPDEALALLMETPGGIGTLTIDGNLTMGADGRISLDLVGADNDTRQAGVLYDALRVTGDARLAGELEMVVGVPDYLGARGDRFRPFTFGDAQGGFDSITALPPGYAFQRDPRTEAVVYVMTATPLSGRFTDLITEDEVDTLNQNVRDRLEDMIRLQELRRREAMADEEGEMSEDEKKKRLLVCS